MSRFYDALKHAGQSLRVSQETIGGEQWEALEIAELEVTASLATVPKNGGEDKPAALPAEKPPRVAGKKAPLPSQPASKERLLGTPARVVVDRKARLLPHTVDPIVLEHYRALRTRILQRQAEQKFRTLLVTSPCPREGKTVTVLNLGLTFAMMPSFKVLVVDGDLRRGSLGEWLGVRNRSGLSNLIEGSANLDEVVLKSDELSLCFMVRGNSKMPAPELLQSDRLGPLFHEMGERFDLVVVDSPPVGLVTDAKLLASSCDVTMLIARAFSTSCKKLEEANQELQPVRVIGTVLNGSIDVHPYRRYSSYYGNGKG